MSQRNVEVVVGTFEAVNSRDFGAAVDAFAEDVTLVLHGEYRHLGGEGVSGKENVGAWFADWFSQFESDYRFEVEESRDLGDRVLVVATHHGRGRASGVPATTRVAYVFTVLDGKIVRDDIYPSREEALEAAGLSE